MHRFQSLILALVILMLPLAAQAQRGDKWVASWVASAHGPYPVGNPSAQPDQKFAFPTPDAGANDQTFRLIVRPDNTIQAQLVTEAPPAAVNPNEPLIADIPDPFAE